MVKRALFTISDPHQTEQRRPIKSRKQGHVRFSEEAPQVKVFETFQHEMSPAERQEIAQELWYTVRFLFFFCFLESLMT
jgi:hypothetical protein